MAEEHFAHAESRLLKCAKCDYVWRHYKSGQVQSSVDELDDSEDSNASYAPQQDPERHNPLPPYSQSQFQAFQEPPPERSAKYKNAVHRYNLDWWLLIVGAIIAVLVLIHEVGGIPSLQWFYIQAHNAAEHVKNSFFPTKDYVFNQNDVSLQVLTSSVIEKDGVPTLNIKCEVVNKGKQDQHLPPFHVALLDQNETGDVVFRTGWRHSVEDDIVKSGERKIFETSGPCLKSALPFTVKVSFQEN